MAERYNKRLDKIEKMEREGKIFVIRPENPVKVGRIEKNKNKLRILYQEGLEEGMKNKEKMLRYLR